MVLAFDHSEQAQRIIFGAGGAVPGVVAGLEDVGARRILLIHDAFVAELAAQIARRVPVVLVEDEVPAHVPTEGAMRLTADARREGVDAIVSVGGGSTTGAAKIVARELRIPIVAVPTTFAGSEATAVWGQTTGARKITGVDPVVLPRVVVYDPELTRGMPTEMAVASGLNAIAHAVDGFWAPRADPLTRALATEGLRALVPSLTALSLAPGDLDALAHALYGAYLCARSFGTTGSGLHHKICHALGGRYALPHAATHAVVLPYVVAFNAPFAPEAAERIGLVFGPGDAGAVMREYASRLGAPTSLAELGLSEEGVALVTEDVLPDVPASNPRPVTRVELDDVIRGAWSGRRIA